MLIICNVLVASIGLLPVGNIVCRRLTSYFSCFRATTSVLFVLLLICRFNMNEMTYFNLIGWLTVVYRKICLDNIDIQPLR